MNDWFRNAEWNQEIAAAFEARLSRARQKAEYLNIQGYMLLATLPAIAGELLRRAIALDDPGQTARACLYLGTALAGTGDLDGAIAALEDAMEAEQRHPMHRTAAYLDQALLIALARRSDLYDVALKRIESERVLPFADQQISALIAQALIRGARGEDVGSMAAAALIALGASDGDSGTLPGFMSVDRLRRRLEALTYEPKNAV